MGWKSGGRQCCGHPSCIGQHHNALGLEVDSKQVLESVAPLVVEQHQGHKVAFRKARQYLHAL